MGSDAFPDVSRAGARRGVSQAGVSRQHENTKLRQDMDKLKVLWGGVTDEDMYTGCLQRLGKRRVCHALLAPATRSRRRISLRRSSYYLVLGCLPRHLSKNQVFDSRWASFAPEST